MKLDLKVTCMLLAFILTCFSACKKSIKHDPMSLLPKNVFIPNKKTNNKCIMVVFVHGTILPIINPNAFKLALDKTFGRNFHTNKSWYQLYLDELKNKSIYRYQPSGPDGLHKVDSQISARIADAMYQEFFKDPCMCYTFGWSGKLSHHKRVLAAFDLYNQLLDEAAQLKKNYKQIEVIIIAHSHGGNVALNLAYAEKKLKKHLAINKLVLLGTPVQSETSKYISAKCFDKVYSFYSHGDEIQKIDNISTDDNWSGRKFNKSPNLVQIELMVGGKKPGHNELWLFCGKDNWLYRSRSFILSPFPAFVFLPIILPIIDTNFAQDSLMFLSISKIDQKLCFSFTGNKKRHKNYLNESVLIKYRKVISAY
jgi:hypothetical protein